MRIFWVEAMGWEAVDPNESHPGFETGSPDSRFVDHGAVADQEVVSPGSAAVSSLEIRLHPVEIEQAKPDRPSGWGGGHSQRKVDRMSAWILRFSDTRVTIGIPRPVTVLRVTTDGKETELEVLELGGEEYPGLRDFVRGQIEKGRPHLILDLSSVERIDSNGVGEIVAVWQHAKNQGGELVLVGLKPRIRDIFEILYLDKVIPIFDSMVEAANHLARSGDEPPGSTDSG